MSGDCRYLVWILCNTYSKYDPAKPDNQLTVEGNVETTPPDNQPSNSGNNGNQSQTTQGTVEFTRNDFLDYNFKLPADAQNIYIES